ncbi:hypothetical protein [Rhizobium sp. HT1-10]|uniref:hypothetical protein n=1 Tax=Rhizobium sp. HT1-10 TaxID=3111638 RepID=UPI003C2641CF
MPNIFRHLPWRLSQFLWAQQAQDRPVENRLVFEGHERERSLSEYEMYYWGFSPAPWY